MIEEDFECQIPVHDLVYSQGSSELRVKVKTTTENGFISTKIDRLKIQNSINNKNICIARPFNCRGKQIADTISLSIEDVKLATCLDNCWQAFDCPFRKVLIYGKVDVLNLYTKDSNTHYKFLVDDGTGSIVATFKVTQEAKAAVSAKLGKLTIERRRLEHKRVIGLNVNGNFLPPESIEAQQLFRSIEVLQNRIANNIEEQKQNFQQGVLDKKALIVASIYETESCIQLRVHDIFVNDKIELVWKRQLNKIYVNEYLKQTKNNTRD